MAAFVGCSFQPSDEVSSDVASSWLGAGASTRRDCWFIIELILCYILHRYLILFSLSQVLRTIYRCFVTIYVHIYHDNLIQLNLYSRKCYWYSQHCCRYCGMSHNNIFHHVILILVFNLQ